MTLPPVDYLDDIFARDVMMKQITFTTAVVGNFQAENLEPLYVFKYVYIYMYRFIKPLFYQESVSWLVKIKNFMTT